MIPVTEQLLDVARKKIRKLTSKERRQCVVYLLTVDPDTTNVSLAQLFDVSERTIRNDFRTFRKEKAKFIKEDDVGLIIADIALDYERQIRDIERSKAKAKIGSRTFLDHCTSAMELRIKMVKALQDLGYYPKNLGNMTIEKFDFKAEVNQLTGAVVTRPVNWIEGEVLEERLLLDKPHENNSDGVQTPVRGSVSGPQDTASTADSSATPPPTI
jgi:hypothetical protein